MAISAALTPGCSPEQSTTPTTASSPAVELQADLARLQAEHETVPGFAIAVLQFGESPVSAATGVANPDGRPLTATTPLRIASNTKTLVAAAVLRLWEQDRIDLDATVDTLISVRHSDMLNADGYDTGAMTVRQLLMHASGLNDHFASDAFRELVLADPDRVWTRTDQLAVLVDKTDPLGAPGVRYAYSDSGYLLLGEMIERITRAPLGEAVRALLRLDEIGLENTWWDGAELPPDGVVERAHQWLGSIDSFPIHGSVDTHGGGGLIASVEDMARFLEALFAGAVFEDPATLTLMTTAPGHPPDSPYRIGLFAGELDGLAVYGHGGFWGTDALVLPELKLAVAGAALDQAGSHAIRHFARELAAGAVRRSNGAAVDTR